MKSGTELLDDFHEQRECLYKGERYSVRDNGAVYRHKPCGKKNPRQLDEVWTFGRKCNSNGYMMISSHRVHIIVATAFFGERDSTKYVVDHKDTNRCNNRVENLRWFTKLENALMNPITRSRIENLCGGDINRFIENPSCLNDLTGANQDILWMRTVSSAEAQNTYNRVMKWLSEPKQFGNTKGIGLGEWIYTQQSAIPMQNNDDKGCVVVCYNDISESLTVNARQKNWRTPTMFPLCPNDTNVSLSKYRDKLSIGALLAKNQYSSSYVDEFELYGDKLFIRSHADSGIKPFSLIKITFENGYFIHEGRTFFKEEGAKKTFALSTGKEWLGPDCIDDYC